MTKKSVVVPGLAITYKGQFSLRDVEDVVKKYMAGTEYKLADVSHDISVKEDSKDLTIVFLFTHEPRTQEECRLRVTVTAEDARVVEHTSDGRIHERYEGTLKVHMRAVTYSNSDEHEQEKPLSYAFYTLFRKFVYDAGTHELGIEMKKYCYDLYDQVYGLLHMGRPPEGVHA